MSLGFEIPLFKKLLLDLCAYVLSVLGAPMTVLGNRDELGQAPGRFWGSGLLGGGNRKNKGSEAGNGLSLATGKW